jgi:hypothetical protein
MSSPHLDARGRADVRTTFARRVGGMANAMRASAFRGRLHKVEPGSCRRGHVYGGARRDRSMDRRQAGSGLKPLWRAGPPASDARTMTHRRVPRERASDAAAARPYLADCTFALWLVTAFLGCFVAAHYLLARVFLGGADAVPPISILVSTL